MIFFQIRFLWISQGVYPPFNLWRSLGVAMQLREAGFLALPRTLKFSAVAHPWALNCFLSSPNRALKKAAPFGVVVNALSKFTRVGKELCVGIS